MESGAKVDLDTIDCAEIPATAVFFIKRRREEIEMPSGLEPKVRFACATWQYEQMLIAFKRNMKIGAIFDELYLRRCLTVGQSMQFHSSALP